MIFGNQRSERPDDSFHCNLSARYHCIQTPMQSMFTSIHMDCASGPTKVFAIKTCEAEKTASRVRRSIHILQFSLEAKKPKRCTSARSPVNQQNVRLENIQNTGTAVPLFSEPTCGTATGLPSTRLSNRIEPKTCPVMRLWLM